MILDIFFVLVFISLALIYFGFYTNPPLRVYSIVGFVFLFILSTWVCLYNYMPSNFQTSGLQYKVGSNVSTIGSSTIVTDIYSVYNDATTFWVGFILAFISGMSIWLLMVHDSG
jgi:hypothetical protein